MNAVTVAFLIIGGVGLPVLALSLLVGDLLHLGHPDADGPFSLPSVAAMVGAFGFGGALAASLLGGGPLALIGGIGAGAVLAVPATLGTAALARAASRMRTDATPTRTDLIGRLGVVITPITNGGYGEVRVAVGGQPVKLNARADHPVPLGAHVFVVAAGNVAQGLQLGTDLTGIDLSQLLARLTGGNGRSLKLSRRRQGRSRAQRAHGRYGRAEAGDGRIHG